MDHHLARAVAQCPFDVVTQKVEWCQWVRETSGWNRGQVIDIATRLALLQDLKAENPSPAILAIAEHLLSPYK